ncbi:hypothetical protein METBISCDRAFT_22740 [Metschnikowia bicuspidata]|uniref:Uncharacterized protein n=1 Tax=Metschnikowia bicuspidata TaxID=27322 RepID=A0A4P9ZE64_9ASCO|nr:hypothetical protein METBISCDRAFT_22740 [Metschnikowia bicuspidata]
MPGREAISGYYIDQKKKYDRAKEVKPSLYTHKTFKDVFESDSDDRLNPIDVVFTDPLKENERGIFSKALKAVQKTIGYDDYDSYDYFAQAREVTNTMKGLSAGFDKSTGKMRISSRSSTKYVLGPKGEVVEMEGSPPRDLVLEQDPLEELYNDPLSRKKYFLSKSNSPKKLSQNGHSPKEMLLRRKPTSRTVSGMTVEEQDNLEYPCQLKNRQVKGTQLGKLSKDDAIGPKDTFLPLWNSILSWVVYERLTPSEDPRINKIEQIMNNGNGGEGEHGSKGKRFNAKNLMNGKKYKQALQKWSDRVSDNFIAPPESLQRNRKQQSAQSDPDVEYEVGFDDDLPDELILKPRTGQLMPHPPKSSVSPPVQQAALQVDENTPVAIISSVNKLIKNIRLMQILFAPIDIIADNFSVLQTVVIILELGIFLWVLYELSIIIDALCMAVKAVCAPMIAVGRFMNRIM